MQYKKIKAGKRYIEAINMKLLEKDLIVLRGEKGYVMCGYLNLTVAEKFKDVAVKIVKVATIEDALKADVYSCTRNAKKLGIYPGQSISEVIRIIA